MRWGRQSRRPLYLGVILPGALAGIALSGGVLSGGTPSARVPEAEAMTETRGRARAAGGAQQARREEEPFPHAKHANVFPLCTTCHAGVVEAGRPMWPEPSGCASCHDGVVERRVTWQARTSPHPGNRRFTHDAHHQAATAKNPGDSTLIRSCGSCHTERGAPRMAVRRAVVSQCFDCHGLTGAHFDLPSEACATCHVPLAEARGLTRDDIARFPTPRSHDAPGFLLGGHGRAARGPGRPGTPQAVSASCATCHVQNFCISCHVNAPELPPIQALASDDRSPVHTASLPAPPSHASPTFHRTHGRDAQRSTVTCASCHARESCTTCHAGVLPRAVAAMPAAGAGRAAGVRTVRSPPPTHTREFVSDRHGPEASARPATCETCHVRATCLECHRPALAQQSELTAPNGQQQPGAQGRTMTARRSGYHPSSFVTRHPSAAFSREANCGDCHNQAQFCQSCHQQSGLVANSRLGLGGYHDAFRGFSLGHGQAARQSLESCASCHAERDCTACHSAVSGGFRFNPHGPGFNASRARSKNPSLCVACHGRAIPGT